MKRNKDNTNLLIKVSVGTEIMNKVILFSPTGYVGSFLKECILRKKNIELLEITRNTILKECFGDYDVMIYSASVSQSDTEGYIRDNVLTAITMVDFCKKHKVKRIIYLSSDSIYGKLDACEVSEKAIMVDPDLYGTTKYLAERIIIESGIPYYILRMPGIVGRVWRHTYFYRLMDKVYMHEPVVVYNSNKKFNNVVDIDDLAQFVLHLCDINKDGNEIFLLGNTEKIELVKIVNYVKRICQSESKLVFISDEGQRYFTLNVNKAIEYGYSSKSIWEIMDGLYMIKNKGR